ncbi:MAG: hypothetical protein ACK4P3_02405 [Fimbriimonadaceae bacterium]
MKPERLLLPACQRLWVSQANPLYETTSDAVALDIDGAGVAESDREFSADVDGQSERSMRVCFSEYLVAPFVQGQRIVALTGDLVQPSHESNLTEASVGCRGWLKLPADQPAVVDGIELNLPFDPSFLVPVQLGFESSCSVRFWKSAPSRWESLLHVSAEELSAGLSHIKTRQMSALHDVDSFDWEGRPNAFRSTYHLGPTQIELALPGNCAGVRLERQYDTFHGRQRCRVLLDGAPVGFWNDSIENRKQRLASSWFAFDFEPKPHPFAVVLELDPPAGAPLWSIVDLAIKALVAD